MSVTLAMFVASKVLGALFVLLVVVGLVRRARGRFHPGQFRRRHARALAGSRYARGEIDADTYRRIRDDLKDLP